MRGFGETGADARLLTHQLWASDVAACLDHFELRQAFLVGWSLGAAVALNAASRYPERVEGMALLGAPRPNRTINLDVFQAPSRHHRKRGNSGRSGRSHIR